MTKEIPLFVEAFFQVTAQKIHQNLYFYYYDPSKIFFHLKETGAIKGELESIQKNLQNFMDEDDLFVNNHKIRMIVRDIQLNYKKNEYNYPFLIFNINSEYYQFTEKATNVIHLYAKPEILPYPAISCWNTIGKIISIETKSFNIINKDRRQLTFYLSEGDYIGGHEKIFIMVEKDF